jgi:hypothetical protein
MTEQSSIIGMYQINAREDGADRQADGNRQIHST